MLADSMLEFASPKSSSLISAKFDRRAHADFRDSRIRSALVLLGPGFGHSPDRSKIMHVSKNLVPVENVHRGVHWRTPTRKEKATTFPLFNWGEETAAGFSESGTAVNLTASVYARKS